MPTYILFLGLSFGVYDDLHAHFVEVVHFVLIEDVEAHFHVLSGVRDLEEEPLGIAVGVDVVLQEQVVLVVVEFGNHGEIAALEAGLED